MKQSKKAVLFMIILQLLFTLSLFASGENEEPESARQDVMAIEMWNEHNQYGIRDIDHPQSAGLIEEFGMYFESPLVNWNGGIDYLQQLRLRIATGDLPDVFLPWGGIEIEFIENGAAYDLTELVKEEMPVYWSMLSDQVRETVMSQSPNGDKLYYLPQVDFTPLAGFIRSDWLVNLGLEIPTTIEEYEVVLRAFRDQDVNGNGDPNDEIPTAGREGARWMDHLFAPFGIAMKEGFPEWDLYNGKVEYAAIQPEMKAALTWIRKLYEENLLDMETFVNTNGVWKGKITGNILGSWYHGAHWQANRVISMVGNGNPDARVDFLPVLKAKGFDGFYTATEYRRPGMMFSSEMSEEAVRRAMRAIEALNNPYEAGEQIEGMHYKIVDGNKVNIDIVQETGKYTYGIGNGLLNVWGQLERQFDTDIAILAEQAKTSEESVIKLSAHLNQKEIVEDYINSGMSKQILGQWVSADVWNGYPDLAAHKLFQEYAANIVIGKYSIDKFDEFVQKWKEQGGDVVTKRVQDYFDSMN
jgi:putative aldouronate transport system substrate-binding protein